MSYTITEFEIFKKKNLNRVIEKSPLNEDCVSILWLNFICGKGIHFLNHYK